MARAPAMAAADPGTDDADADTGAGADTGGDDADTGADDGDMSDTVLVTIAQGPNGGYLVYSGDEPDGGDEGESADDDAAMGGGVGAAGGAGAAAGGGTSAGGMAPKEVQTVGEALKAALDILNEAQSSSGAAGSSEDQFAAGYAADQSPTPAMAPKGRGLKYPPAAAG